MNRTDEHRAFEGLAVGHALSALEPDEEQRFLAHLQTCARCERDVEEHRATMADLAYSVEDAEPPPSLLEGIRAGMRTSGQHPDRSVAPFPVASVAGTGAGPAPAAAGPDGRAEQSGRGEQPGEDEVTSRRRRRIGVSAAAQWTAVAAAVALIVSLGVWNASLRSDRDASHERLIRLEAAVQELGRPGTETVPLTSDEGEVLAVAMVHDREVSLVVDGLAPNGEGTTYVLWSQDPEGGVRPVGAFDVSSRRLDVVDDLPALQARDGVTLLVSREQGDVAPPLPGGPVLASGEA